jgi:hypothetical protein
MNASSDAGYAFARSPFPNVSIGSQRCPPDDERDQNRIRAEFHDQLSHAQEQIRFVSRRQRGA